MTANDEEIAAMEDAEERALAAYYAEKDEGEREAYEQLMQERWVEEQILKERDDSFEDFLDRVDRGEYDEVIFPEGDPSNASVCVHCDFDLRRTAANPSGWVLTSFSDHCDGRVGGGHHQPR